MYIHECKFFRSDHIIWDYVESYTIIIIMYFISIIIIGMEQTQSEDYIGIGKSKTEIHFQKLIRNVLAKIKAFLKIMIIMFTNLKRALSRDRK